MTRYSFKIYYENVFIRSNTATELAHKNTLVFVVDTHMHSRTEAEALLNISEKIVVIDHHRKTASFENEPEKNDETFLLLIYKQNAFQVLYQ